MKPLPPTRRLLQPRKIWEIEGCYKCALIGTCLTSGELRKLARERIYAAEPGMDAYQLHGHFIQLSGQTNASSQALHTYVEKKYRSLVKKYRYVFTDDAIKELWDEDVREGRVDSAWWAVMTHPLASQDLIGRLYGYIHMLSHDCTSNYHKDRTLINNLHTKTAMLEEVLASERQFFRQEKRQMQREIVALQQEVSKKSSIIPKEGALWPEAPLPVERVAHLDRMRRQERQMIADLRQDNNALTGRIDQIIEKLDATEKLLATAMEQIRDMEELRQRQELHEAEQRKKIVALEALLLQEGTQKNPCLTCSERNTGDCPGPNLCGKTVLYVGGLHKLVPHYRQLVEQHGGRFIHHDGGKEASRNLLPKMLLTADAVFCPVDCVSHDACNCVKKMCKRHQKPFILMRSSGLSSLAKGLSDIVQ